MTTMAITARKYNVLLPILLALIIIYLVIFPNLPNTSPAQIFGFTQMFLLIILASNWNLIGGFTGYVDFGHTVFFGIGAYTVGVLMAQPWFIDISATLVAPFRRRQRKTCGSWRCGPFCWLYLLAVLCLPFFLSLLVCRLCDCAAPISPLLC